MSSVKFVLSLATLLTASMLSQIFPNSAQASERMDRPEHSSRASQNTIRLAQAASEKEAFEGAKELGTLEAWEAFLNSFPKGFRADLARAYVRRLGNETKATPAPAPTPAQVAPPPPVAPPPQPVVQTPTPHPRRHLQPFCSRSISGPMLHHGATATTPWMKAMPRHFRQV
jgi:hypothetical protein